MEDNNFLENIDFSENFLTQDKMKCELLLPTQCDSSVELMVFLYLFFTKPVQTM